MAHYGTLRDHNFLDDDLNDGANDIRGANVYGLDDKKLGKIDDVIFNHSTGQIHYIVLDAGGWLSSKKFIVPPQQLQASSEHKDDFVISVSKDQIEKFPPYHDSDVESEGKWRDYESRYQEAWVSGAIQHLEGSDHKLTPAANAMPVQPRSPGSRWSTFDDRLRSRRRDITSQCETCRAESPTGTASERERDELRKAG